MHLAYLKRHRRGTYTSLLTSGTLAAELAKIDAEVRAAVVLILDRLKAERGITESLKAADPLRWAQEMNAAKHDAEEMVLSTDFEQQNSGCERAKNRTKLSR